MFTENETQPDYEFYARTLQQELEIDSWTSFLELHEDDLASIPQISKPICNEILDFIEFAKS